jgi:hypothetical protein
MRVNQDSSRVPLKKSAKDSGHYRTVSYKGDVIAKHAATALREPVRSWKKRSKRGNARSKSMTQVYISSKPAPLP